MPCDGHSAVQRSWIFIFLYMWQAIPISRQPHILELAIGRLQDKSSIVRKSALQLLKTCLIYNPFGAQVSEYLLVQKVNNITDETVFLLLFFFLVCVCYKLYTKGSHRESSSYFLLFYPVIYLYIYLLYLSGTMWAGNGCFSCLYYKVQTAWVCGVLSSSIQFPRDMIKILLTSFSWSIL